MKQNWRVKSLVRWLVSSLCLISLYRCQTFKQSKAPDFAVSEPAKECSIKFGPEIGWGYRETIYRAFDPFTIYPQRKASGSPQLILKIGRVFQDYKVRAWDFLSTLSVYVIPMRHENVPQFTLQISDGQNEKSVLGTYTILSDEVISIFLLPWAFGNDARLEEQFIKIFRNYCLTNPA